MKYPISMKASVLLREPWRTLENPGATPGNYLDRLDLPTAVHISVCMDLGQTRSPAFRTDYHGTWESPG